MDRISESTSLFPLERVPRLLAVTSRHDGAASLDDLDQLHTELERLLGAATDHLNTVEQYLRSDDGSRNVHRESKSDGKSAHRSDDRIKKHRDLHGKTNVKSSGENGLDFSRLRELDEKLRRGGPSLFATLRDNLHASSCVSDSNSYLSTNGSSVNGVARTVDSVWSSKSGFSAPIKTCYSYKAILSTSASQDEPITLRVLRSSAHSRRNSVSTASTSSPSTDDFYSRRADSYTSPNVSQSRYFERSASNGISIPAGYDSHPRCIGGRVLRNRGDLTSTVTSPASCSSPRRLSLSPASNAETYDSRSWLPTHNSSEIPIQSSSFAGYGLASAGNSKTTFSNCASDEEPLVQRKRGRPPKSSPPKQRLKLQSNANKVHSNRLLANYRHEVPTAFWRHFDQMFLRELRNEDMEFVRLLRACGTMTEAEVSRLSIACSNFSQSHTHSSRLASPNSFDSYNWFSEATEDDSPISTRLRLRNGSNCQSPHYDASATQGGFDFRAPPPMATSVKLRDREPACSLVARNGVSQSQSKRNGYSQWTVDSGVLSCQFSPNDQRDSILRRLRPAPETIVTVASGRDLKCRVKIERKSESAWQHGSGNGSASQAELNALARLVDSEKRSALSGGQASGLTRPPQTEVASAMTMKRHLVVPTNDDLKIRIRLASSVSNASSANSSVRPDVQKSSKSSSYGPSAAKRQRVAEIDMNAEMTANLLLCISDSASCEMHLAKLLPSTSASTGNGSTKLKRKLQSLSLKYLVGRTEDELHCKEINDLTRPLTVRTPERFFGLPAGADNRLLLPTSSVVRKLSDAEAAFELQRLLADLRCTNEWNKNACDALLNTVTQQIDRQPLLSRLRELEGTISDLNKKITEARRHSAVSHTDIELAQRVIDEREIIFQKLNL